jgi:hypothetical protein
LIGFGKKVTHKKIGNKEITDNELGCLESCANYHSYFLLELNSDNTIHKAYLMDASGAPELTEEDIKKYNFSRRVSDEGMKQIRLNKKEFSKFWDKRLIVSLEKEAVEYVKSKSFEKIYRCRPLGWVLEEIAH